MLIEYRSLLPDESKEYRRIRLESLKEFPEAFSATYQETLNVENLLWKMILKIRQPTNLYMVFLHIINSLEYALL